MQKNVSVSISKSLNINAVFEVETKCHLDDIKPKLITPSS